MSVFSFPDDNFSKYQWIFTKLIVCIVETWFRIADGQISSILTELVACDTFVFSFLDNNFSKSNLVCALILSRSALGLLMGELSANNTSVFYFQDNNLSKSQWIFTKFDMCIYFVEICFGIAHCQISSILTAT